MKRVLTKVIYVVVVVLAILIYISAISYITSYITRIVWNNIVVTLLTLPTAKAGGFLLQPLLQ